MSTTSDFADYITGQIKDAGEVSVKKMFGEYAVYCEGRVTALICNNMLYVKPTESGKNYIGDTVEAPPYKGAKPHYVIEDGLEDREWISGLIRITAEALPLPKPKKISPAMAPKIVFEGAFMILLTQLNKLSG